MENSGTSFRPGRIRLRQPGKLAKTTYVNEVAAKLNSQSPQYVTGGVEVDRVPGFSFLAKIVAAGPDGEANYANANYWVEPQAVAAGNVADPAALTPDHALTPTTIVTATNSDEIATGSHNVSVNTPVRVFAEVDRSDPPKVRYVFSPGGAAALSYARFIAFAGDNLITAHPCNADATTIDLATTIYLMLTFPAGPSNRPPFATFVANVDVLGYFPIPSGFAITLSGHAISGVLESFTQWPYASSVGQGPYCSVANSGTTAATIIWDWPTLHPIP